MVASELVELLTTPKAESVGTLVLEYVKVIRQSSEVMNNAIENDKVLIVGREAHKINEAAGIIVELLRDK